MLMRELTLVVCASRVLGVCGLLPHAIMEFYIFGSDVGHSASVTEVIGGLCKHESNQPRPGVAPGDPQHEAEGWTWCPRGRESSVALQRVAQVILYGKVKTP